MNAHAYEMPTWLIIMVCTVIYHPSSLGHPCLLLFLLQLSEDNLAVFSTLLIRWEWCNRLRSLLPTDMKRKPLVSVLLAPFHTDTCLPGCCCHYHVADLILVKGVRLSRCCFFFCFFFWTNCSTFVRISTWHLFFIKSAMCCGLLPEMDLFSLLGTVVHALSLFTAADVKSNQLNYMWLSGSGCIQRRTNRHPTYHLLHNNDDIDMKEQCLWSQWGFDLHLVTMLMKWSLVK